MIIPRTKSSKPPSVEPFPERGQAEGARPQQTGGGAGTERISDLVSLEQMLGYTFRDPARLQLALTHRSHPYEERSGRVGDEKPSQETKNSPGTDNEQLEFLGDAVLGLAATELLFRSFPEQSEGELTRMRASLVSRQRMAAFGTELRLGDYLIVGRSAEQNGVRRKPAILANAAEAVLAAIYLDARENGDNGLAEVLRLVEQKLLRPELISLRAAISSEEGRGALRDPKTVLQERVQAEGAGRLSYADTGQTGPAHQRRFRVEAQLERPNESIVVLASAEGSSKKEAQQRAAELALERWNTELSSASDEGLAAPAASPEEARP